MDPDSPVEPKNSEFTLVFGKRRGSCTVCKAECSFYKGSGGPCNECGCYPTAHVNLDSPCPPSKKRKRSEIGSEENDYMAPGTLGMTCGSQVGGAKRPKYLLEVKYYQKLFFSCLQFMTLPQISAVCSRAPVPIFVKVCFPSLSSLLRPSSSLLSLVKIAF
jgi:hypothetical protein